MPPRKHKLPSTKESFDRLRKPVAPPTKVEKDRRRKLEEERTEREANEELLNDDELDGD